MMVNPERAIYPILLKIGGASVLILLLCLLISCDPVRNVTAEVQMPKPLEPQKLERALLNTGVNVVDTYTTSKGEKHYVTDKYQAESQLIVQYFFQSVKADGTAVIHGYRGWMGKRPTEQEKERAKEHLRRVVEKVKAQQTASVRP